MTGDMYSGGRRPRDPARPCARRRTLLHGSAMLRAAFGDDVIDHYHHAAQWEISETDRVVTDFEVSAAAGTGLTGAGRGDRPAR